MKFHLPIALFVASASAWTLDLYTSDGRHASMHGTVNACNNMAWDPVLNVNKAKFDPATADWPDPNTFELYVNKDCSGLSYRNGKGTFSMSARKIKSYKITST